MIWVHTSHLKLAFERIIWISSSRHWEWKLSQENQAQSCPPSGTSRNRLDWQKSQILSTRATLATSWTIPTIPLTLVCCFYLSCRFCLSLSFVFLIYLRGSLTAPPAPPQLLSNGTQVCRKSRSRKKKQGFRSRSRLGVCALDHLCLPPPAPHTGQSGLAHAQTTSATATAASRVVWALYLLSAFAELCRLGADKSFRFIVGFCFLQPLFFFRVSATTNNVWG